MQNCFLLAAFISCAQPALLQFGGTWDRKGCEYTRSSKNIKAEVQKKQEDFVQPGTLDVRVHHGLTKHSIKPIS